MSPPLTRFGDPHCQAREMIFRSQPEVAQTRVVVGPAPERPMVAAIPFLDRQIVDARQADAHQALAVELPVLVAIAAEPAPRIVVPFIGEANRDAVVAKS